MKHNFFIVDDDDIFNTISLAVINRMDPEAQITVYQSSAGALSEIKLKTFTNTIFLFDIRMPSIDGFKLLDAISELPESSFTNCKFYLLTSSLDERDRLKGLAYKCVTGFIEKPLTTDKLKSVF